MIEPARIEEIQERLRDFVKALRQEQADAIADRIQGLARDFTHPTQVRRSVAALNHQLEQWRARPRDLPSSPVVHIAANRLEDTCKDALSGGVILAARPSIRTQGRRKLRIVIATVSVAVVVLLVPVVLTMSGIDLTDLHLARELSPITLPQGEEVSVPITALTPSARPADTHAVEFFAKGHCAGDIGGGASCRSVDPRSWPMGKLPTFELLLPDQAYGLVFAVANPRLVGAVGQGELQIAATEDTPEGNYRLPLLAAFVGYRPERCSPIDRARNQCQTLVVDKDARDDDLAVPIVTVTVTHGDPSRMAGEKRRKQAEAEEKQRAAAERATQIAAALTKIKLAMDQTEETLKRKRFEDAHERLDKLAQLFAPLETLAGVDVQANVLPTEVEQVHAQFEDQQKALRVFEDQTFDQAFTLLTAPQNQKRSEDQLLAEAATRQHISIAYMTAIYAAHADDMEQRLQVIAQAKADKQHAAQAALELRCGPLPTGAWKAVNTYLPTVFRDRKLALGECLTPRLSEARCWTVTCDFKDTLVTSEDEEDRVTAHRWTFMMRDGRVAAHSDRVLDPE